METVIKKHLAKGEYHSALTECITVFEKSSGVDKYPVKTLLKLLTGSNEIISTVDVNTIRKIENILEQPLVPIDYDHFIGRAAFPVYNKSGCRLMYLRASEKVLTPIMGFKADDKTTGNFYSSLLLFWQFIQTELRAVEPERKNDVTVLNWGLNYTAYSNGVEEERLMTGNDFEIEGDSFHFAALVATISNITDIPVDPGLIFTGTFENVEKVAKISNLKEKTAFLLKEHPGLKKIVIPHRDSFSGSDKQYIRENESLFLEVESIPDILEKVFNKKIDMLFRFSKTKRHKLGTCRIIAENVGDKEITIYDKMDDKVVNEEKKKFNVIHCTVSKTDTNVKYNVFPMPFMAFDPGDSRNLTLIVIDYPSANQYLGNYMSNNSQTNNAYAIGIGQGRVEAQIFAHRRGNNIMLPGKYFRFVDIA